MSSSQLPIVVGVDGSACSVVALDWAAAEAARRSCRLHVVHVSPVTWMNVGPDAVVLTEPIPPSRPPFLDESVVRVSAAWPDLEVTSDEVVEGAASGLVALSDEAALVVVGSHGRSLVGRMLMGSVSRHLLTHARCPAVVVRGTPSVPGSPVAVGLDDSPTARGALRLACAEATLLGVALVVVHAWQDLSLNSYGQWYPPVNVHDDLKADAEALTADAVAEVVRDFPDLEVHLRVRETHPVEALLDAARESQLLVVGAHGRGAFAGMTLGSVTTAAIHHSSCPVMSVPAVKVTA
jgi:nucleotide-binding universal stress UspA family protein